jgi:hypothetical protein
MWSVLGRRELHAGFWWERRPLGWWEDNVEMELIGLG